MEIKSFNEIKGILEKFPEMSKAGYVVTPQLLKIAKYVGLLGYDKALNAWFESRILNEKVYPPGTTFRDIVADKPKICVNWDGLPLIRINDVIIVGLKRTIELIEEVLKLYE